MSCHQDYFLCTSDVIEEVVPRATVIIFCAHQTAYGRTLRCVADFDVSEARVIVPLVATHMLGSAFAHKNVFSSATRAPNYSGPPFGRKVVQCRPGRWVWRRTMSATGRWMRTHRSRWHIYLGNIVQELPRVGWMCENE